MHWLLPAQIALLSLSVFALYSTWYLFIINGSADILHVFKALNQLPTNVGPQQLLTSYTGIAPLDAHIQTLVMFFASVLSNPSASLQVKHFGSQVLVGWSLLLLESLRPANKGRAIAWLGLWGILVQNATLAATAPILFIVHLAQATPVHRLDPLQVTLSAIEVISVGVAMLIGYILPTYLMGQDPEEIGWLWKQRYIAIWQLFPIWVSLTQQACGWGMSKMKFAKRPGASVKAVRITYAILLFLSIYSSLSVMKDVAIAHFAPERFGEGVVATQMYRNVFIPQDWTGRPVLDLAQGTKLLLIFDEIVTGMAFRVWALMIHIGTSDGPGTTIKSRRAIDVALVSLFLWLPVGFAVAVFWLRDEMVWGRQEDGREKKTS